MSGYVRAALATIVEGGSLSLDDARVAMGEVMDGEATPAQLAAMLMGLRMRGETIDELAGFATAMRERVVRVEAPAGAIDVVGTGGDGSGTFNISTSATPPAAMPSRTRFGSQTRLATAGRSTPCSETSKKTTKSTTTTTTQSRPRAARRPPARSLPAVPRG